MSDTDTKNIRFIDSQYNTLFFVPDGGNVVLTYSDGEKLIRPCEYLDDYRVRIGGSVYHICEFAEKMERNGTTYAPEKPPSLPDRCYSTLSSSNELLAIEKEKELASWFFNNPADAFSIFHLKDDDGLRDIRFEPLSWVQCIGYSVERDNYNMIYTDRLTDTGSTTEKLNALWDRFNNDHPEDFRGHSLSVSDIVALKQNGTVSCHYVDSFGFQVLPGFLQPENYLKNAEMAMEDDYDMIDGIINNGQNPSVAELDAPRKAGQQIPLTEPVRAVNAERSVEKRKSVLEQLTVQPAKPERHNTAPFRGEETER